MHTHFEALGFPIILEKLKENALSDQARAALDNLEPFLREDVCTRKMNETTAARRILDVCGSPPLASMKGMEDLLVQCETGAMLLPEQLTGAARFASSCKRTAAYLRRGEALDAAIGSYGRSLEDLSGLREEIERCVGEDRVYDEASPELRRIRRKTEQAQAQIKEKLAQVLQGRKSMLADSYIATRSGHYVLPVQRRYQNQFDGTVIEASGKGSTVFMEPRAVAKLQGELSLMAAEEDAEIRRILYTLTALTADHVLAIRRNMDAMERLDVLFAKAKLSAAMKARAVTVGGERRLDIRQARHPLLEADRCVPLNIRMDESTRGVIITGPNTGGKTVAIKTVGLLTVMAQCGLHVPCGEDSYIAMQDGCWCDIGDSQNIAQNLSTFSGHITNVIHILDNASPDSLVLLDELGSGTDPAEGMGIAVAVLEELRQRGCMFLVTTHYAQVKTYAEQTPGVVSARMAFDRESLRPLYRLEMGKSGESCALHIAGRLGMAPHLLDRAYTAVYGARNEAYASEQTVMSAPKSQLVRMAEAPCRGNPAAKFARGDSVALMPDEEIGIVYRPADDEGYVIVQVKGEKRRVRHTRLRLKVAAAELYPPDYDFSILFDTVENRKARHIMGKRYDPDAVVTCDDYDV